MLAKKILLISYSSFFFFCKSGQQSFIPLQCSLGDLVLLVFTNCVHYKTVHVW